MNQVAMVRCRACRGEYVETYRHVCPPLTNTGPQYVPINEQTMTPAELAANREPVEAPKGVSP